MIKTIWILFLFTQENPDVGVRFPGSFETIEKCEFFVGAVLPTWEGTFACIGFDVKMEDQDIA